MSSRQDATLLVQSSCAGDPDAASKLLPLVYDELRARAQAYLAQERSDHTLQATALVHEAYLRMVDQKAANWQSRAHFCAVAATVMRRILVDHARGRGRLKRGGNAGRLPDESAALVAPTPGEDLVGLDEALERMEAFDARKARIVELRFFGGLTIEETAAVVQVSPRTVRADWRLAKAWLHRELSGSSSS